MRVLCRHLAILAAAVLTLLMLPGCSTAGHGDAPYDIETLEPGERAVVRLPLEFEVAPGNRLYLHGERVSRVELTTSPGESLYLNGVPILPAAHRDAPWYEPPSDEDYLRWFGDVPFVQELIASGGSPSDAAEKYIEERERVTHALWMVYAEVREEQDVPSAVDAALARLPELDTLGLIDWEREPIASGGYSVKLYWKGIKRSRWTMLMEPSNDAESRIPSEPAKAARATMLYEALTSPKPCWCFIGLGGFDLLCGKESVAEVEAELSNSLRTGDFAGLRHLDENAVREILEREGGGE